LDTSCKSEAFRLYLSSFEEEHMIAKFRPVALALMSLSLYVGVISGQGRSSISLDSSLIWNDVRCLTFRLS